MNDLKHETCCFSGYRIEKMPFGENDSQAAALCCALERAVGRAAAAGYTGFFSGMATGLDLWAAEAVLRVRERLPVRLLCAIPYEQQPARFPLPWQQRYRRCLLAADEVHMLSPHYHSGCFAVRNRFMVERSSLLICYYDGRPGGTAQTVQLARRAGLRIVNLADAQLSLPGTEG